MQGCDEDRMIYVKMMVVWTRVGAVVMVFGFWICFGVKGQVNFFSYYI